MFLLIPRYESTVSGMRIESQHIQQNILGEEEDARHLADEQLQLSVVHDGSNQFCCQEACNWHFVFLAQVSEDPISIVADEETLSCLVCLPKGKVFRKALVTEMEHEGTPGIWLLCILEGNQEDVEDDYDLAFNLVPYHS